MSDAIPAEKKRRLPLWLTMTVFMLAGAGAGLCLSPHGLALVDAGTLAAATPWVVLPARLFMALIMLIVMPLVICSIILAITGGGSAGYLRHAGSRIIGYFLFTTTVAVSLGMVLSKLINPAAHMPEGWSGREEHTAGSALAALGDGQSLPDLIVGFIPANPMTMLIDQNMMQIIIVSAMTGLALLAVKPPARDTVNQVLAAVLEVCMRVVSWAMALAPLAVFGFLFRLSAEVGPDVLQSLAVYIGTVLLGLLLLMVFYMILVAAFANRNPFAFLAQARDVFALAFSSSSSAACLPLTLHTVEQKMGVRPEVARLVVPLGITINMDGTAIYQVIVALFLTGLLGIELTAGQQILLAVTIIGASIATPGTPGVGIVILAGILAKLGVPPESIGIILSVDRLLDMCRTVINVTGDMVASVVMNRWLKPVAAGAT